MSTTVMTPERSREQRLSALARANEIRSTRAELKREMKRGGVRVDGLLLDPPAYLETAKVIDLLLAVPKTGRVKANKILARAKVSPSKTIGGLSDRQRGELVGVIRGGGERCVAVRRSGARQRPVGQPYDARLCEAVRSACASGWAYRGWAATDVVADEFGVETVVMAVRLSGAARRGLVEKRVTVRGVMWKPGLLGAGA